MCYSFKTSLITYIMGMSAAIFALITRQFVLGTLILAYSQIQLGELMIWHGIDKNSSLWNRRGTKYVKYMLSTHNIAVGIGILLSIYILSKETPKMVDYAPLLFGCLMFIIVVCYIYPNSNGDNMTFPYGKTCTNNCNNSENRLYWTFPHSWYIVTFISIVVICLLWVKPRMSRILLILFFTMSFVASLLVYPQTMSSIWCWSASFIAPVIVIMNYFLINGTSSTDLLT